MWEWHDAWILQAVVYASRWRRRNLSYVIAAADAINVDIPLREPLERSVNRLRAAGLADAEGDRVWATRAGRRLVRRASRGRRGIRELPPLIEARLHTIPSRPPDNKWRLSEVAWRVGYEEYLSRGN